jgi:hypothetical protein
MSDTISIEEFLEGTAAEQKARLATAVFLNEDEQSFVDDLVDKLMVIGDELSGLPLRPYQVPFARRIYESLILSDGARITALFSRQSGKTEAVSSALATAMLMLPRLAKIYPKYLEKYKYGLWVGAFAPVDRQSGILYSRIVARLTSDRAKEIMADPEINERVSGRGSEVTLVNCKSRARKMTCHPRAIIEGDTFHVILIDEAQGGDDGIVRKSVLPMGAANRATCIYSGTPTYTKNFFYTQIQENKRIAVSRGRHRQNHFHVPWEEVAKYSPLYALSVQDAMIEMGEDSDEFRLSYKIEWLLDSGMFTTSDRLDELGDVSMQKLIDSHTASPVVVGIDCARIQDRTIVTVVLVDWSRPDAAGYYPCRILNWLDLEGVKWEEQYYRIYEFLSKYNIFKVGVDGGGVGDVVIDRLRTLMPNIEFVAMSDGVAEQSKRWKHLKQLMDRAAISWPWGAKVRQRRVVRRFRQEMEDLELDFKGPNMKCEAPGQAHAHDDYPDSLAMAVILTKDDEEEEAAETVVYSNFLMARRH